MLLLDAKMGIFYSDKICGVRWILTDESEFQIMYLENAPTESLKEEYKQLTDSQRKDIQVFFCKSACTTYDFNLHSFLTWFRVTREQLETFLGLTK